MGVKKIVNAVRHAEKTEAELEAKRQYKEAKKQAKEEKKLAKKEYKEEKRERKELEREQKELAKQAKKEQKRNERESRKIAESIRKSRHANQDGSMPLLLLEEFDAWSDSYVDFDAGMIEATRTEFMDQSIDSHSMSRSEMSGSRGGSQRHRQNFSSRRRDGGSRSRSPTRTRTPSPRRSRSPLRDEIPEDAPCSVEKFMVDASDQDFAQRRSVSPVPTRRHPRLPPRRAKSDLTSSTLEREKVLKDNLTEWSPSNPDWVPPRGSVSPHTRRLRDVQSLEWSRNGAPAPAPVPRKSGSRARSPTPRRSAPSRIPRESISKTRDSSVSSLRSPSPKRMAPATDRTPDRMIAAGRPTLNVSECITPNEWRRSSSTPKADDKPQEEAPEEEDKAKLAKPPAVNVRARSVDSALLEAGYHEEKCSLRHAHLVF